MTAPYATVTADDVRSAVMSIRSALATAAKPRWWRAMLALARLRERGELHEWPDVEWTIPPGKDLGRQGLMRALADVLGAPAAQILALDRSAGRALHDQLGQPEEVLVDIAANPTPGAAGRIQVVAVTGFSSTDKGIWVDIGDPGLTWSPATGLASAWDGPREYNPSNDVRQQQGLKSGYPLLRLKALGRSGAHARIAESRRECPYLVLKRHTNGGAQPTCAVNGEGCTYKAPVSPGEIAWGTGGPKVLLERQVEAPHASSHDRPPGADPPVVDHVDMHPNHAGLILGPGWTDHLRAACLGSDPSARMPAAREVATVVGWLRPEPSGPVARERTLADLIGEDVLLKICV